jgi:hypothetical protein
VEGAGCVAEFGEAAGAIEDAAAGFKGETGHGGRAGICLDCSGRGWIKPAIGPDGAGADSSQRI